MACTPKPVAWISCKHEVSQRSFLVSANIQQYLYIMAKAKKKSAKEASNVFHNIMQASVKGNPKPIPKKK